MFKTSFFLAGPDGSDPFCAEGDAAVELVSQIPGVIGYTQTRTTSEQIDPTATSPFTGVAELWLADGAAAIAAEQHQDALQGLLTEQTAIAAHVCGMMRTVMRKPSFYGSERVKGVFPFRCQQNLGVEQFQKYWWLEHGPIAARTEGALCYTQCHPLLSSYQQGRPPFDGITELYWSDVAAARVAMGSRQMREEQAADAENFAEPGSVILFLASEEVVLAA